MRLFFSISRRRRRISSVIHSILSFHFSGDFVITRYFLNYAQPKWSEEVGRVGCCHHYYYLRYAIAVDSFVGHEVLSASSITSSCRERDDESSRSFYVLISLVNMQAGPDHLSIRQPTAGRVASSKSLKENLDSGGFESFLRKEREKMVLGVSNVMDVVLGG